MTNSTIQEFAKLLANEDEAGRKALLKRAQLLAMNEADPEQFEPPISTLKEYLEKPIPVPPIVVTPHILVRGGITCTIGRAGKGKTVMNLNRILRWGAGLPLFDKLKDKDGQALYAPADGEPVKTLIIENEGAAGLFHKQIGLMLHATPYLKEHEREDAAENVLVWGDGGYSGLKLDDPKQLDHVRAGCEKFEPDVLFVEPFRGLWKGEENSSTDMAVVADALSEIGSDYNCAILLAHHERKSGAGDDGEKMSAGRGSTVLEGVVSLMENFESVRGDDYRELSTSKARHGAKPAPVRMEWDGDHWWYRHVPLNQVEQNVLDFIADAPEPPGVKTMATELGETEWQVRKVAKSLKEQGRVKELKSATTEGGGSTGYRYRLCKEADAESDGGGLEL